MLRQLEQQMFSKDANCGARAQNCCLYAFEGTNCLFVHTHFHSMLEKTPQSKKDPTAIHSWLKIQKQVELIPSVCLW